MITLDFLDIQTPCLPNFRGLESHIEGQKLAGIFQKVENIEGEVDRL